MLSYPDWKKILAQERLPAAMVGLDAFDRNLASLGEIVTRLAPGKKIRIATKSIRVPELIARAVKRGAPYHGLMCFSAEEASFLAQLGLDDFLVAYPTLQHSDLKSIRRVHESGKKISLVVDCEAGVQALAQALRGVDRPFAVLVEIDASTRLVGGFVHLGVRRSPIRDGKKLADVIGEIQRHSAVLCFGGLMAYEAQIAGLPDRNPFKPLSNPVAAWVRQVSIRTVARFREDLAEFLESRHLKAEIFNGGGTGSIQFAAREPWLTEVTVGSGLLCPHLFDYYSNLNLEPAVFFALQAARVSNAGYVTCQGGGYIASGTPGWDRIPRPYLPEGLRWTSTEAAGEVQSPLRVPAGARIRLGDPILFRHAKAGELAERFNEYLLISSGQGVARTKTYRGLGQCYF